MKSKLKSMLISIIHHLISIIMFAVVAVVILGVWYVVMGIAAAVYGAFCLLCFLLPYIIFGSYGDYVVLLFPMFLFGMMILSMFYDI